MFLFFRMVTINFSSQIIPNTIRLLKLLFQPFLILLDNLYVNTCLCTVFKFQQYLLIVLIKNKLIFVHNLVELWIYFHLYLYNKDFGSDYINQ